MPLASLPSNVSRSAAHVARAHGELAFQVRLAERGESLVRELVRTDERQKLD